MQKKRIELLSNKVIYSQTMEYIEKEKTFFLFKSNNLDSIIELASYANEKGFNLIGVDMKTPGLNNHLKSLKKHGQKKFGVFSVSSKKEARIAINAGASFIFSTHCDRGIIRRCNRETVFNSIGCITPSELAAADEFGAGTISIFPCNKMGGVSWFVFLREIFPNLRFIPTDKMNPSEASMYLREGAYAVAPIIDLEMTQNPRGLIEDFKTIK
jgi:2-dehydro-3-deoxyphosphogluconate aldolase / (4S)-4-hydroxy-2-oxoglutarate aldolase